MVELLSFLFIGAKIYETISAEFVLELVLIDIN